MYFVPVDKRQTPNTNTVVQRMTQGLTNGEPLCFFKKGNDTYFLNNWQLVLVNLSYEISDLL